MRVDTVPLTALDGAPGVALRPVLPARSPDGARVEVAVLEPGVSLPQHAVGREQVFSVVEGHGRVAGDDGVQHAVGPGSVVVRARGEVHTSWADTRMTVVIVQHG